MTAGLHGDLDHLPLAVRGTLSMLALQDRVRAPLLHPSPLTPLDHAPLPRRDAPHNPNAQPKFRRLRKVISCECTCTCTCTCTCRSEGPLLPPIPLGPSPLHALRLQYSVMRFQFYSGYVRYVKKPRTVDPAPPSGWGTGTTNKEQYPSLAMPVLAPRYTTYSKGERGAVLMAFHASPPAAP